MPEDSLLANKVSESLIIERDEIAAENDSAAIDEDVKEEKETEVKDDRISPTRIIEQLLENKVVENNETVIEENIFKEPDEEDDSVVRVLLNELINCIVYKEGMEVDEMMDVEEQEVLEEEQKQKEENKEEEIEVIEDITVEQKKNIIAVDLIEKLDDEEEEEVYTRRSPSPVTFIPGVSSGDHRL